MRVYKSPHALLAENVHIGVNKNKIMFVLPTSKAHGRGDLPQIIKISGKTDQQKGKCDTSSNFPSNYCPFNLLKNYIKSHPCMTDESEQFFVFRDKTPVKPDHIQTHLQKMLKASGFKENLYSFHGLRGGRVGNLLKLGVSVENIKKLGRWRSNTVFKYFKYI